MTQEEKELLLKDLCARLPYGVNVSYKDSKGKFCRATVEAVGHPAINCNIHDNSYHDDLSVLPFDKDYIYENPKTAETYVCTDEVQIFLRPMSSMTKDEKSYMEELSDFKCTPDKASQKIDFYNSHHIDYRGLISIGLALEAPEGMYSKTTCDNCPDKDFCSQSQYIMANCYKLK